MVRDLHWPEEAADLEEQKFYAFVGEQDFLPRFERYPHQDLIEYGLDSVMGDVCKWSGVPWTEVVRRDPKYAEWFARTCQQSEFARWFKNLKEAELEARSECEVTMVSLVKKSVKREAGEG